MKGVIFMLHADAIKNRLKRVEGQVRGVLRMMEEEKECKELITQLTAIRSAVDKSIAVIVANNLEQCMLENQANGIDSKKLVEEAVQLLVKSR